MTSYTDQFGFFRPGTVLDVEIDVIDRAKVTLKELGWSYRAVAPVLGVHFVHLSEVLNGRRSSQRLLTAIENLSQRPTDAKKRRIK